jgi:hypothetical protein
MRTREPGARQYIMRDACVTGDTDMLGWSGTVCRMATLRRQYQKEKLALDAVTSSTRKPMLSERALLVKTSSPSLIYEHMETFLTELLALDRYARHLMPSFFSRPPIMPSNIYTTLTSGLLVPDPDLALGRFSKGFTVPKVISRV